jgi:hypothetical protein
MELSNLISEIKRDGKISSDALVTILADAVQNGDDVTCIYKHVYKKAYGEHLSEKLARDWVKKMSISDDSERVTGEKWTYEQTTDVGNKVDINWNKMTKWEWYAALNGAYSDYYEVAKEYQVETDPEFFASLAKAFWCSDHDVKNKTIFSYYFNYVA